MDMKKNKDFLIIIFLLIFTLASRLFFLNSSIDFFDSMQYVHRSNYDTLFTALSTGHAPHHPGYVFLTYLTNNFLHIFKIFDAPLAAAIPSAVLGSLTIVVFYLFAKKIFSSKIALLASILVAITPYFWISNIAVIVDPTMIFFYILSLYLYLLFLEKRNLIFVILSGFALGYAVWAHTQIAFWLLGFVALFFYKTSPKDYFKVIFQSMLLLPGIFFFIYLYLYVLVNADGYATYFLALKYLINGNSGDHMPLSLKPGIYNYLVIMTIFGAFLSVCGVVKMLFDRKYRELIMLLIWLIPGLILSALYLYANLYGRSSMICIFPAVLLVAYLLLSWQAKNLLAKIFQTILIFLVIIQLLIISLPIVYKYATEPGAFEEMAQLEKKLNPNGLLIVSNLAKTTTDYKGNSSVIWEFPQDQISSDVKKTVSNNQSVYLSQDAIMFPYFRYDGVNWETYSTDLGSEDEHKTLASSLFSKYNLILATDSKLNNKNAIFQLKAEEISETERLLTAINNLGDNQSFVFGRLIDQKTGNSVSQDLINIYSNNPRFTISPERINYRDGIYFLKKLIYYQKNKKNIFREPLIFTYTDLSGYFSAVLPKHQNKELSLSASSFNLSSEDVFPKVDMDIKFSSARNNNLLPQKTITGETEDINEIISKISDNNYYLTLEKNGKKIKYTIYYFSYEIEMSSKLPATNLLSQAGDIVIDDSSEMKEVRHLAKQNSGLFVFGPWINLSKGKYEIKYRLKISSGEGDIGKLYLTYDTIISHAEKLITSSDVKENDYQDYILNIDTKEDLEGVEFKIESTGGAELYLDYISVIKK